MTKLGKPVGSTTVTISDTARVVTALHSELQQIETLQLECGEQIASLLLKQVRLAEKSAALLNTMKKLMAPA